MIRLLRDLAGTWADQRFVKANDVLRRKLITAEASIDRLKQEKTRLGFALRSYGQLCQSNQQMRQQAEAERDEAQRWVVELEQTVVSMAAKAGLDDAAWADVAAVAGPQCPEGLIRNGDVENLVRCNLIGGHEGNHRGDRHEWPQIKPDTTVEVPW